MHENRVQWRWLTTEEKDQLLKAVEDGKRLVYYNETYGEFIEVTWRNLDYYKNQVYRLALLRKPTINWSHVAPEWKWLAVNKNGLSQLFKKEPYIKCKSEGFWRDTCGSMLTANSFASLDPGTVDWADSLVERPTDV